MMYKNAEEWQKALEEEYESLIENITWVLKDLSKGNPR